MAQQGPDVHITLDDAARILGAGPAEVSKLVATGQLPVIERRRIAARQGDDRLYTLHYNEAGEVVTGGEDFEGDQ